jgi:hypothetical protein
MLKQITDQEEIDALQVKLSAFEKENNIVLKSTLREQTDGSFIPCFIALKEVEVLSDSNEEVITKQE